MHRRRGSSIGAGPGARPLPNGPPVLKLVRNRDDECSALDARSASHGTATFQSMMTQDQGETVHAWS